MRKLLFFLTLVVSSITAFASHIVGGEMFYRYVGAGSTAGTNRYTITLRLFRDQNCPPPCAAMPANVWIGIFDNSTGAQFPSGNGYYVAPKNTESPVGVGDNPDCVVNPPVLNYNIAEYNITVDLPENTKGYTAAYQTCCRVNPMTNVFNTGAVGSGTGSTYACSIPGTDALGAGGVNNSPVYSTSVSPICQGKPFSLDFSVEDPDQNDQVTYYFCDAFNGGSASSASNINPAPPPYQPVPYINGYTANSPLGTQATIDPETGIISGIAPQVGRYVVAVCANEYRNGKLISIHRKDFIVNVANCDYAGAQLEPSYTFCNSLNASFQNLNNSDLNKSYTWDFGDGTTSTVKDPVHTYKDTGTYTVTLEVNKGEPCAASTTAIVRVYPFFNADFSLAGGCVNKPTQFTDRTTTTYGTVTSWNWNFGGGSSKLQNPSFTFENTGDRSVQLIATNSKGCTDTIVKLINITDKPFMDLRFRDTLICRGDQLQLEARGQGNFTWTPNTAITGANTATPTVSPSTTTSYVVKLDIDGCINFDTVQVRVVNSVTLQGRPDTTICATDSLQLGAVSNGLKFSWSPVAHVRNPTSLLTMAAPTTNTVYRLTATIGGCSATDEIQVSLVPYPLVNAGPDKLICYDTEVQLNGSTNGQQFAWTPTALVQDNSITPMVRPLGTQAFILTATSNLGCPKPARDTAIVTVLPPMNAFAGNDTAVIIGQPLQLKATGGIAYRWMPPLGLNDPNIANPLAIYDGDADSIRYTVLVANEAGCEDTATVVVRVFRTNPGIFVPSAFTPNSDGANDVFRPIPVGMSRINYFRVYNRWGQMVFQSSDGRSGWDGRINGVIQNTNTYVWLVDGVDYTGKKFTAKGTVTLIR